MIYFITVAAIIMIFVIVVLWYFALSPQQAIFALFRRIKYLMDNSTFGLLLKVHAQYREVLVPANKIIHCPCKLDINTYDRINQCSHPDVIFFADGFGFEKWRYWMVLTPYPFSNDRFENPSIFVSKNGLEWHLPKGMQNPIVVSPPGRGNHNSDPCLLYNNETQKMFLYFRKSIKSTRDEQHILMLMTSVDGVNWTKPIEIINDNNDAVISPTVIYRDNRFTMWSVNNYSQPPQLVKRTSFDGISWCHAGFSKIEGLMPGRSIWHLDILPLKDRLHALFVTSEDGKGSKSRIHYSYSSDDGDTWVIKKYMLKQVYEFESALQYRGCLVNVVNHDNIFEVWYSAMSKNAVWSIVYLPMILVNDNLIPLGSLSWKFGYLEEGENINDQHQYYNCKL